MKVAIYGQSFQKEDQLCVEELLDELKMLDAEVYVEDLALAFEEVARRYPGVPVYLQGESLGAAIALQWDIRGDQRGHGLILNAPPVVVNLKVGP